MRCLLAIGLASSIFMMLGGCTSADVQADREATSPAKVERQETGEADLMLIRLTEKARERLGIQTQAVESKPAASLHTVAGEVIIPPGQVLEVAAPIAGTLLTDSPLPLIGSRVREGRDLFTIKPLLSVPRDLKVNAQAELDVATARLEAAKVRTARASQMLEDRVGSERALQDAEEAEHLALTTVEAAKARLEQIETAPIESKVETRLVAPQDGLLRQLHVAPGQMVSAGTPLFEVARLDPIWIRVPVFSGDLALLDRKAAALVKPINAATGEPGRRARPVAAPPSADPFASTSDLFYQLPNSDHGLKPGERVSVAISMLGEEECLQVPWSSILYDIHGGTWVYEQIEPLVYSRKRVSVERVTGSFACLASGPPPGTPVVSAGAAELFGTEFGGGK
ncbi:efflux RND transporter periplasmic adaptor subunit [Acidobacteria bacterium AH-259-G07]|nr:efflux RND transporter periplasmic adaptor subunit [Acidobacteria bacterium AH-259-G07]